MGCTKTGSGIYAGNSACRSAESSRIANGVENSGGNVQYVDGIPYATTTLNFENKMPLGIFGAATAGLNILKNSKIQAAQDGGTEYTRPTTVFGKILGRVSGRSDAYAVQEQVKAESSNNMDSATAKNLARQGFPLSGSLSYGAEQNSNLKLFALVGAVIVSIFYFNCPKGRIRRR
jgi:hypothetical protein